MADEKDNKAHSTTIDIVSSPKTPGTEASTPSPKKKKKGKRNWNKSPRQNKHSEVSPGNVFTGDPFTHHHHPQLENDSSIAHSTFASSLYSCCGQPFHIFSVFTASGHPQSMGGPAVRSNKTHPIPQATDLAVVYTSGLRECGLHFEGGFPELIVFDVPACKVEQVCRLFAFLAHQMEDHRLVKGGEIVDSDDLVMETKWIACPWMRARLFDRFPFLTRMSCGDGDIAEEMHPTTTFTTKWLLLQPQFPLAVPENKPPPLLLRTTLYPRFWGSRPPAPEARKIHRDRIVDILMTKVVLAAAGAGRSTTQMSPSSSTPTLIWYVDGNSNNNSVTNKQEVTLYEAFAYPYMNVDWIRFLDGDNTLIAYTKAHMEHFALIFKPRNGKVMTKDDEDKIQFIYYLEYLYSPYPITSAVESGHQQRGNMNLDFTNFSPHNSGLSLPEVLPFGF